MQLDLGFKDQEAGFEYHLLLLCLVSPALCSLERYSNLFGICCAMWGCVNSCCIQSRGFLCPVSFVWLLLFLLFARFMLISRLQAPPLLYTLVIISVLSTRLGWNTVELVKHKLHTCNSIYQSFFSWINILVQKNQIHGIRWSCHQISERDSWMLHQVICVSEHSSQ